MDLHRFGIKNRLVESIVSVVLIALIILALFLVLDPLLGKDFDFSAYLLMLVVVGLFTVVTIYKRPVEEKPVAVKKKTRKKKSKKKGVKKTKKKNKGKGKTKKTR